MKLMLDITPAEVADLLFALKHVVPQDDSPKPAPAASEEETLASIAASLGLDPSKLEVVDIGNGLSAVKAKKGAQVTPEPKADTIPDDKPISLPNGDGTTTEYRYGDIPKNSRGQVKVRWLDEHCKCGNEKHGSPDDYAFDDGDEANDAQDARADNPGGYL